MASLKCRRVLSPMGIVSNGYERRTTCLFFAIVCRQRDQCLLHSIIITSQPAGSMQGPSRNTPKQMPLINSVIYILHSIWLMETNLISKRLLLLETFSETLRLHIGGKKCCHSIFSFWVYFSGKNKVIYHLSICTEENLAFFQDNGFFFFFNELLFCLYCIKEDTKIFWNFFSKMFFYKRACLHQIFINDKR